MKPRSNPRVKNVWIEILVVGTAIAFGLGVLIATLGVVAGAASGERGSPQTAQPSPQQTYEGMVTCSRCGARHSAAAAKNASDCALICVHGGAKFALLEGNAVYLLDGDLDELKKVAGERARITGALRGNTIKVSSVAGS